MTKEKQKLEELFHIRKEVKNIEKRMNSIEKQNSIVADVVQNGVKGRAVIRGLDVKRAYKLEHLQNKLKKFRMDLLELETEIEEYIENIPFSEIRQIFRFRYLDGMNWVRVAHAMNREYDSDKYTEDVVRCKCDRYLEKN